MTRPGCSSRGRGAVRWHRQRLHAPWTRAASDATIQHDMDGDAMATRTPRWRCMLPVGYIEVAGDCDDGNAEINPGAEEICDGIDNDCDASTTDDWDRCGGLVRRYGRRWLWV